MRSGTPCPRLWPRFAGEKFSCCCRHRYTDWDNFESWSPNIGCRVSIFDSATGKRVQTLGGPTPGERPNEFIVRAPPRLLPRALRSESGRSVQSLHSIAVDSSGDIYCAEVSNVDVGSKMTPPRELVSLRKWRKVA